MSKTKTIFKTVLCMSAFVALMPSCEAGLGKWLKDHFCCCCGGSTEAKDARATELTVQPPEEKQRQFGVRREDGYLAKQPATTVPATTIGPDVVSGTPKQEAQTTPRKFGVRRDDTPYQTHGGGSGSAAVTPVAAPRKNSTDGL